jgi:hypothetical protein
MSEATLPLQAAVVAALKAHAPLAAIVGAKVFDRVPAGTAAPYVTITGWQEIEDGTDCSDASELFFDVQCYSTAVGRPEAARIAGAVKAALHRFSPAIADWSEVEVIYRSTQYFTESDNATTRAVVNFQALTDSDQ